MIERMADVALNSCRTRIEDTQTERARDEIGAKLSGPVMDVEDRIHFHEVDRDKSAAVVRQLHREMGLAKRRSTAHRRSNSRRLQRVDPVGVDRKMKACSPVTRSLYRVRHRRTK